MRSMMRKFLVGAALWTAIGCGDSKSGGGDALTTPTDLKATTVSGKPHLTWTDAANEESYMIERMDDDAGSDWMTLSGAEDLVPNTTQYHDTTADPAKHYMYRVMAMKGSDSKLSNEVSWP